MNQTPEGPPALTAPALRYIPKQQQSTNNFPPISTGSPIGDATISVSRGIAGMSHDTALRQQLNGSAEDGAGNSTNSIQSSRNGSFAQGSQQQQAVNKSNLSSMNLKVNNNGTAAPRGWDTPLARATPEVSARNMTDDSRYRRVEFERQRQRRSPAGKKAVREKHSGRHDSHFRSTDHDEARSRHRSADVLPRTHYRRHESRFPHDVSHRTGYISQPYHHPLSSNSSRNANTSSHVAGEVDGLHDDNGSRRTAYERHQNKRDDDLVASTNVSPRNNSNSNQIRYPRQQQRHENYNDDEEVDEDYDSHDDIGPPSGSGSDRSSQSDDRSQHDHDRRYSAQFYPPSHHLAHHNYHAHHHSRFRFQHPSPYEHGPFRYPENPSKDDGSPLQSAPTAPPMQCDNSHSDTAVNKAGGSIVIARSMLDEIKRENELLHSRMTTFLTYTSPLAHTDYYLSNKDDGTQHANTTNTAIMNTVALLEKMPTTVLIARIQQLQLCLQDECARREAAERKITAQNHILEKVIEKQLQSLSAGSPSPAQSWMDGGSLQL